MGVSSSRGAASEGDKGDCEMMAHDMFAPSAAETSKVAPMVFARRWVVLAVFVVYSFSNAYQWIHLNIIGNVIMRFYNASLPTDEYRLHVAIDWLSMIYMLAYIPLILPSTWLLDRHGLRVVGIAATLLNALGAWIKVAAVSEGRFAVLMFGQTVCAIAQVFILGIPARLGAVWFGPDQVSTATAIGVFGNQLGCAFGFVVPPEIVPDVDDLDLIASRLRFLFYGGAIFTTLLFVCVLVFFSKSPPVPPSQAQAQAVEQAANEEYFTSLRNLVCNKGFMLLLVTYGINTGSYYAVGTLLNPIVLHYFPGETETAGRIGLTLVVSGVLGSILAGVWLDRTKLFKRTALFIYSMSFLCMVVFAFTLRLQLIWMAYICAALLGFFMTGYLPVGFEFAAEITYPESEGTSSGLLNASAQAFGIILTLGMRGLMNWLKGARAANICVCAALFIGSIGTAFIRSDLRRQKAGLQLLPEEAALAIPVQLPNLEEI